jgi:hypothetical protein
VGQAFRLCLNTLQHDTEGGCYAHDDEPILIVIGFHGTFGTGDANQVWRLPLAGAARPGASAVGTFAFPASAPAAGARVQIMGAAVIAVARDRTPLSVVAGETDAAVTTLREQLAPLLRHARPAFWNPVDAQTRVTAAIGVVRDTVTYGLLRRLGGFAASIGDPDDQFDVQLLCFSSTGFPQAPGIGALHAGETAVRFGGPFAGYWIDARLDEITAGSAARR